MTTVQETEEMRKARADIRACATGGQEWNQKQDASLCT